MNILGAITIDLEKDLHTGKAKGITLGLPKLLALLEKYHLSATFFATGQIIKEHPLVIKNLYRSGHEIALHGYSHKRFDSLSKKEKEKEMIDSIRVYKKVLGVYPKGFRAPQHSIDLQTISILEEHKILYDSSKTPGNAILFRHLFNSKTHKKEVLSNFFSKKKKYSLGKKLIEIPRSSFLISAGGFELKVYPSWTYKLIIFLSGLLKIPFIFTMHSWDLIDIKESKTSQMCNTKKFLIKLDRFLEYSSKKVNYSRMQDI